MVVTVPWKLGRGAAPLGPSAAEGASAALFPGDPV